MKIGKNVRLDHIIDKESKRTVIIPMDDGLLDGPEGGLRDMPSKIESIVEGKANAILGFKGVIKNCYNKLKDTAFVMNLTASTTLGQHTRKTLVGSVKEAIRYGAMGVAVHVNISSKYENEMLHNLGYVSEECEKWGMPLLAIMYPRKESSKEGEDNNYIELKEKDREKYTKLVRHCARIGAELGSDIIKVPYTGSVETFQTVVESCPVPVIIAGGPKIKTEEILNIAYDAMKAGAAGVCFGRNGFHRENTTEFVKALKSIIHEEKSVNYALRYLKTRRML